MRRIDVLLSHVWMVRAFLKHSDEAQEDEDLAEVHRALYDYMLALGEPLKQQDAGRYLKLAQKKLGKLKGAAAKFGEMQPRVSTHTNFQMAAASLSAAVEEIGEVLARATTPLPQGGGKEENGG
jgi:cob(I)alamin adenosyltransferase